jgi:hypothetical protein
MPQSQKTTGVVRAIFLGALACWMISQQGCSRPRAEHKVSARPRFISKEDAAEQAARIANDQCEKNFHKRPFKPEQYPVNLQDGTYHWGGLDVGGPGGYSALVTFRQDGSDPHVEVYFSDDRLAAPSYSPPAPNSPRL